MIHICIILCKYQSYAMLLYFSIALLLAIQQYHRQFDIFFLHFGHILTPFTLILPDMHCGRQSGQSENGQNPSLNEVLLPEMTETVRERADLINKALQDNTVSCHHLDHFFQACLSSQVITTLCHVPKPSSTEFIKFPSNGIFF